MSESEFNDICESMAIPPYKHNFKTNKISEKTQDFDTWFRENLDDRNTIRCGEFKISLKCINKK